MPHQVGGQHADEHVGPHPAIQSVMDGAQVEVVHLDVAEVPFHVGQILVGIDDAIGVQLVSGDRGAKHVDPVERGLGVDGGVSTGVDEGGVGDGDLEVLGHLSFVEHLAHLHPDVLGPDEATVFDGGDDRCQGRGEPAFDYRRASDPAFVRRMVCNSAATRTGAR